jgi:hypothetical protein
MIVQYVPCRWRIPVWLPLHRTVVTIQFLQAKKNIFKFEIREVDEILLDETSP